MFTRSAASACLMIGFQLEAEFTRLTNVNARRGFFNSLDTHIDHLLELLRGRSGASGKIIQEHQYSCNVVGKA